MSSKVYLGYLLQKNLLGPCWQAPPMDSLSQSSQRTDDYFTAGSQDFSFLEFPNTQDDDPYMASFTGSTQPVSQQSSQFELSQFAPSQFGGSQFDAETEHSQITSSIADLATQVDGLMNFDETFEDRGKDLPEHACVYVPFFVSFLSYPLDIVAFTILLVLSVVIFPTAKNGFATVVGIPLAHISLII